MSRCVVCLFTVCSTGSFCVLDPRRVPELTPGAMTLQLYVTVVRCSQTGWIETTGLKKSLGSDGRRVGLARNLPVSLHVTAGPVVASGVVVVVVGVGGGGGGGHSLVGGAAAAAASAVNLVAAVGVVGDDSCSVSPL